MQQQIIILGGPTASGKTALAIDIAQKIDGVIINADSQQVYKEIPIITAQPSIDEQKQTPHMLYSIISANEYFSVANWLQLVFKAINDTFAQGKTPILVGGTGMYIKSLVDGIAHIPEISHDVRSHVRSLCDSESSEHIHRILQEKDPEIASKLKPADKQRIIRAYEVFLQTGKSILYWQQQKTTLFFPQETFKMYFLFPERQELYERCNRRFINMLGNGAKDEVRALHNLKIPAQMPAMNSIGVPELFAYESGVIDYNEMLKIAQQKTRNYVKRQLTFFRNQMKNAVRLDGDHISADRIFNDTIK